MILLPGRKYKLPVLMTEGTKRSTKAFGKSTTVCKSSLMGTIIVWLFVEFYILIFLQCNRKVEKLQKLEISEWSVIMVRMGNSGPLNELD